MQGPIELRTRRAAQRRCWRTVTSVPLALLSTRLASGFGQIELTGRDLTTHPSTLTTISMAEQAGQQQYTRLGMCAALDRHSVPPVDGRSQQPPRSDHSKCAKQLAQHAQEDPQLLNELLAELGKEKSAALNGEKSDSVRLFMSEAEKWGAVANWQFLNKKLSSFEDEAQSESTLLFNAIYWFLWALAVVWLFFGEDTKGIFNKIGCQVQWSHLWSDLEQIVETQTGIDVSSGGAHGETPDADCEANAFLGWAIVLKHLSTFGMLVAGGPMAFHTLRTATQSARHVVVDKLTAVGFEANDARKAMYEKNGRLHDAIELLLEPRLRKLLKEAQKSQKEAKAQKEGPQPRPLCGQAKRGSGDAKAGLQEPDSAETDQGNKIDEALTKAIEVYEGFELGRLASRPAEAADDQAEVARPTAQLSIRIRTILRTAAQELSWIRDSSVSKNVGQVDDTDYQNGALQVLSDSTFDEDDADEQTREIPREAFERVFWLWAVGACVTLLLVLFRLCVRIVFYYVSTYSNSRKLRAGFSAQCSHSCLPGAGTRPYMFTGIMPTTGRTLPQSRFYWL